MSVQYQVKSLSQYRAYQFMKYDLVNISLFLNKL